MQHHASIYIEAFLQRNARGLNTAGHQVRVNAETLLSCPSPFLIAISTAPAMEMVAAGTNTFKAVDVGVPIGLISVGPTMTLAPESKPVPVMASITSTLAGVLLGLSAVTLGAATAGGVVVPGCVVAAPPLLNLYKAAIQ